MAIINKGGQNGGMGNMMQMMQMMQSGGGNPSTAMMQMLAQQNPAFGKALQMMQGKSPQEIQSVVQKMYADQGLDINQFMGQADAIAKQFGIKQ